MLARDAPLPMEPPVEPTLESALEPTPPISRAGRAAEFVRLALYYTIPLTGLAAMLLCCNGFGILRPPGGRMLNETEQRIDIIEVGLQRWSGEFNDGRFPNQSDYLPIGGYDPSGMTGGEFLRFVLFPPDDELVAYWASCPVTHVDHAVLGYRECRHMLDPEDALSLVDPWNQDFRYEYPGQNHERLGHLDKDGKVADANHSGWNAWPDIWSVGANGVSDRANWATDNNQTETNDDITNWFDYR